MFILPERLGRRGRGGGNGYFSWSEERKKRNIMFLTLAILMTVSGFLCYMLFGDSVTSFGDTREDVYITIKPGMTAMEIAGMLEERGVIGSRHRFRIMAKLDGSDKKFKAGTYRMYVNMPIKETLSLLVDGSAPLVSVTIPEGFTVKDIAWRLESMGVLQAGSFLESARYIAPYDYMSEAKGQAYRAEGFLFPDTYSLHPGSSPSEVMGMMTRNFDMHMTDDMREAAKRRGISIYELITLASIVEKEAKFDEDRPLIAQVFLRRLMIGMPLQSDATVQYVLKETKEDLTYSDIAIDSPYNTYRLSGLPPGPIANPGLESIKAVLDPADTDYLYFVADLAGHNHFSKTYEEHLETVERVR